MFFSSIQKLLTLCASVVLLQMSLQPAVAQIRDGGIDPWNLGKGDWIYFMNAATNKLGGNVASVTNETSLMLFYKSQGIRYIIIKAGTGAADFNGSYSFPQFTASLVNKAHAAGILIFGYTRSDGIDVPGEIALASAIFNKGADGFVFDAESEWESQNLANNAAKAWQLCSTVRSNWPTKFLAHAPFPIISGHSSFPYKEFGYWCDAVMPQVYPAGWTNVKSRPSGGVNWMDVNWYNWQNSLVGKSTNVSGVTHYWTNAIKPIIPANHVYGPNPPNTGVSEIPADFVGEFIDYLIADPNPQTVGGYQGANFWRADLHGSGQWGYIKGGTSGSFTGIVNNIVIDDPKATTAGAWTSTRVFSNGSYSGNGSGTDYDTFGTNYLTKSQGDGTAYVQFTPNILVAGDYDVYQRHPTLANASVSVPHIITYNGGTATVNANQQTNAGKWSLLGRFNFAAGTGGNIRVTDGIVDVGNVGVADGIKLVFVSSTASAPVISTQPQSQSVQVGQNATFTVVASGIPAPGYQWKFNGTDIVGATTSTYTRTTVLLTDAGNYSVLVTNTSGSALSSNAVLTVTPNNTPPSITAQPQSQTKLGGQTATFSVTATGTAPLTYNWRFGGNSIPGATTSSYSRVNVQASDAGSFDVIVTNNSGSITSAPAVLTVNYSLTATAGLGGSVSLNPNQAGYTPNTVVTATATANPGFVFSGWSGDATGTSNPLGVTMTTNKAITANFAGNVIETIIDNTNAVFAGTWSTGTATAGRYGDDYRFATAVSGASTASGTYTPTLTAGTYDVYIWYTAGGNRSTNAPWVISYSGGTTNIPVNQQLNGASWFLIATNLNFAAGSGGYIKLFNNTSDAGKVVMADAVRFVNVGTTATPPGIAGQPQNQTVNQGGSATFTVSATGTGPLNYQWQKGGSNIGGATDSSYTVSNALPPDAGSYSVVVTNAAGTTNSSSATLTVNVPPGISAQPQSQTVNQGGNATFIVTASGTAPLSYQWQKGGSSIGGATDSSYSISNATPAAAGNYSVVVTNAAGATNSSSASLTVNVPPAISDQPQNQAVNQGDSASFSVTANGTAPLNYQWLKDGSPISGAVDSSYTIASAAPADAGNYSVVITNVAGYVTSSNAMLAVNVPPTISTQPQGQSIRAGSNVTFTVTASGSGTLAYQWNFNGEALAGATTSSYAIVGVQTNQTGSYSVAITNVAGTVNSSNAVLTVTVPEPAHIDEITTTPDGQIQMILSGEPAGSYIIEGSSNLVNWVTVTNLINTNGTTQFTDGSVTNNPLRFYRARLEP